MNNAISPGSRGGADFRFGEFARRFGASFRQLHAHPALAWITPQLPVRLIESGGVESLWLGGRRVQARDAELRAARFTAVEVPGELALSRRLVLPQLSERDLHDALALEVRDSNPFDPAELVWGYRATAGDGGQLNVVAALAARSHVRQHIQQVAPELLESPAVEAWVMADDGAPVVLRGFGEAARQRRAARARAFSYALMILALLLATAIAVTPTVQLHVRTLQAVAAYGALQQRAGPAMAQREALVRGREDLANLQEVMNDHVEPLVAIDMLTQMIPDDTWVQRVQAQGSRFTLGGQTPNAAALMNTLSSNVAVREVRSPTPATRTANNRENFVVEFTVAPGLLHMPPSVARAAGPVMTVPAAPVPAPQPAASLAVLPAAAAAAASSPVATASQAARPAAAASAKAQP